MYRLPLPEYNYQDCVKHSIASFNSRNKTIKEVLEPIEGDILIRCERFDDLMQSPSLINYNKNDFEISGVSSSDLARMYPQFRDRAKTKDIYSSIKNSAPNDICPYCGIGTHIQVDHYLPKDTFGSISVHPNNLVPACSGCNFAKSDYAPSNYKEFVLHPYFDDAFEKKWLYATLREGANFTADITFFVDESLRGTPLYYRLSRHMEIFKLHSRYKIRASKEMSDIQRMVRKMKNIPSSQQALTAILEILKIKESGGHLNSWEGAFYDAFILNAEYQDKLLRNLRDCR